MHDVFKPIDFGSFIKEKNFYTGEIDSKRMKGVLVYSLQQQFEKHRINMSVIEEGRIEDTDQSYHANLTYQLNNYVIDKFDARDQPVFAHKGDHMMDALMLANYAFVEGIEKSTDFTPVTTMVSYENVKTSITSSNIFNKRTGFINREPDPVDPFKNIKIGEDEEDNMYKGNRKVKPKMNNLFSHKIKRNRLR